MIDRSQIPSPREFYTREFPSLRPSSRSWVMTTCCFHRDTRPSLALNLSVGNFVCHACGVKGGDVIDFVRQRYEFTFQAACAYLNVETSSRSTNAWINARK